MKVGTFGMSGMRWAVAAAIARTLPAADWSRARLTGAKYICASPRITAVTASGALLNGTCTMLMPACLRNSAPAMNVVLARPGRREIELARLFLGELDDLLQRLGRQVRRRDQEQRRRAEPGDAGEILHRIERQRPC